MSEKKSNYEALKELITEKFNSVKELIKPAYFADVTTTDDTVLSYEGELAVGTQMMVTVDDEKVPAPEGSYDLTGDMEGTTVTLDAEGKVVEIVKPEDNNSEEGISEEEMNAKLEEQKAELEKKFESEKQEIFKKHKADLEEVNTAFEAYQKEIGQNPPKNEKFSSEGFEHLKPHQKRLLKNKQKRN